MLTDGIENSARYIADVAAEINEKTYAIGLGTPQNTSASALQTISGNNGGYLLVTGAIGTDNAFVLQKYFLQILAGVSNAEVVVDPDGQLVAGAVHRIPFQLNEGDAGVDVILLSPSVRAVDFRLQTPTGLIIEPWRAMAEPAMRYVLGNGVSYYRLVLPTQLIADRFDQGGTWHALLTIGRPRAQRTDGDGEGIDRAIMRGLRARSDQRLRAQAHLEPATEQRRSFAVAQDAAFSSLAGTGETMAASSTAGRRLPYSLIVHSYSNVALRAELHQSGYEPGAHASVLATLTQSGVPLRDGVVWGELTRPDGSQCTLTFHESEPGGYEADFVAGAAGVHKLRVRARGHTRMGLPVTREQALTAVVWHGGSRDAETAAGGSDRGQQLCELLACLLAHGGAISREGEKHLHAAGLDLDRIRKCLAEHCIRARGGPHDG